jgi:hypothetical protein
MAIFGIFTLMQLMQLMQLLQLLLRIRFLRPTSYLLMLELTFRTVIIWDSAAKPVTRDATDATVTNVTNTA